MATGTLAELVPLGVRLHLDASYLALSIGADAFSTPPGDGPDAPRQLHYRVAPVVRGGAWHHPRSQMEQLQVASPSSSMSMSYWTAPQ